MLVSKKALEQDIWRLEKANERLREDLYELRRDFWALLKYMQVEVVQSPPCRRVVEVTSEE